jgi:hypothetical protein
MNKIKRITNPEEFRLMINDLNNLFSEEKGHLFLDHDAESIKRFFSNQIILNWDFFVWANFNGENYDAMIAFTNEKSVKFNCKLFNEYLWLSKNPKVGYRLFREAIKFAREKDFKYILMSTVTNNPKHEKIKNFYKKMGFLKDTETYIAKL